MNVHGRIAAAAITAALSLSVGAVPALAEDAATAADVRQTAVVQQKAEPQHMAEAQDADQASDATDKADEAADVNGQAAGEADGASAMVADAAAAPQATVSQAPGAASAADEAAIAPTFSVEKDLAGKELIQLSIDDGKTYSTVAVKADTVDYVSKVTQSNGTYQVMVNLDYADEAKMAEYLPAGANAADYEFRMGYSNQHIYLQWDASAQQWVASPNNKCKLTFKGPEAPEVVTAPDAATVALQARVGFYVDGTYQGYLDLEEGHYTPGKVEQGADGSYTYYVTVSKDDLKYYAAKYAKQTGKDYYAVDPSPAWLTMFWNTSTNPHQWIAGENASDSDVSHWVAKVNLAEVAEPTDEEVAENCYVNVYAEGSEDPVAQYDLEAGHYTRQKLTRGKDGSYGYAVTLSKKDLAYYAEKYGKESGKNVYAYKAKPAWLYMYFDADNPTPQWMGGKSADDWDGTWVADVNVREIAEPTDAEVAKSCYVNVYEQGSDKVAKKYKLEAGHYTRWNLEKAADGTVTYKVSVDADDLKYYASKYAGETGRDLYAVDPRAQVLYMHFDATNPTPQWMGGQKVGDFSGDYRATVTVAEVAEPTDDEIAENCMADIYLNDTDGDAVAEYPLEAGHYARGKLVKGEDGVVGYTVTLSADDIEYYAKKYAKETGKPYAAVDTTPVTLYMYFDADNPTPQWMGGKSADDWDGTWVADISVKDIALTTDDVNAAMGEPAVYVTDRDCNLIKAYEILDGTYTVEYDGTHAHLTIVGQGQQAYINKLNGEDASKFYVSENGLTTVPLSYELEYANGKWGLESVGQYQMAVWDVAPVTGQVKVHDEKSGTTSQYDLADGTFDHSAIVYDDATGTCRTTVTLKDYETYIAKFSAEQGREYRLAKDSKDVAFDLVYDMNARPGKRGWKLAEDAGSKKAAPRHMRLMAVEAAASDAEASGNDTIDVVPVYAVTVDHGYDADGDGKNETDQVQVAYGDAAKLPELKRDGYTFKGWKTADGADFDPTAPMSDDTTVVAQWEKNPEPSKPAEPAKPATNKAAKPEHMKTSEATKAATPNTGDPTSIAGIGALLAGGLAALFGSKRKHDQD